MNYKQYQKELGKHVDLFHLEYKLGFPNLETWLNFLYLL